MWKEQQGDDEEANGSRQNQDPPTQDVHEGPVVWVQGASQHVSASFVALRVMGNVAKKLMVDVAAMQSLKLPDTICGGHVQKLDSLKHGFYDIKP